MSQEGRELLCCRDLQVGYREAILPPIDAVIRAGELWVVIGRNGSGKTTWFKTMLGLTPPIAGRVERAAPRLSLSYVPQRSVYDDLFPLLARDVVAMGADRGGSFFLPRLREPAVVRQSLADVGALELADRSFRHLSEGQKQRILLARLAASKPDLALLDEPTAAMDAVAEREAFEYLDHLRRQRGLAVVVVSHYIGVAREFADRAIFLERDTQSVVIGTPDEVLESAAFLRSFGEDEEHCAHA